MELAQDPRATRGARRSGSSRLRTRPIIPNTVEGSRAQRVREEVDSAYASRLRVARNPFQRFDVSVETLPDESIQVTAEKPRQGFVDAQRICLHRENDGGIVASAGAWTIETSAGTKWSFTDIDGRVTLSNAALPGTSRADSPSSFDFEYELTTTQSGSEQTAHGRVAIPNR